METMKEIKNKNSNIFKRQNFLNIKNTILKFEF